MPADRTKKRTDARQAVPYSVKPQGGTLTQSHGRIVTLIWTGVGKALLEATSWKSSPAGDVKDLNYAFQYAMTRLHHTKMKNLPGMGGVSKANIDRGIWSITAAVLNPRE
ncbi:hypothetical protein JAAARDRAFT_191604 [Jaapia argillacea MUCL 33604]|uniref:Uncharacterized protein n=1 Tax=Jaapia argillacea MUCL 33604 TaxID=933084 RepID=A0A067PZQ6_9AGAM|nr:hypothetical protein JAAARDRAFT_191604 [Jaapia argillacea MUCL 33604]